MKLGQFFVRLPILGAQESIFIRAMADEAKRSRGGAGPTQLETGRGGGRFSALRTISNFTYEMVSNQRDPAREGRVNSSV